MCLISIRSLGNGAFGRVDLVQTPDGKQYAQKLFSPQIDWDINNFKQRFIREVNVQKQFNHPNIVPIIKDSLVCDPLFFLMPVASSKLSIDMRQLNFQPNIALFDILQGLEEIHYKGFSHRDLKPDNILRFDNQENEPVYAISDFGLIDNGNEMTTLTATGMRGGTPYYAAPELFIDLSRATHLCDIYSFGAILHDIYSTGNRAPGETLPVSSAPGRIGYIINKCTQRLPARRYQSVNEIRQDLYLALNDSVKLAGDDRIANLLSQSTPLSNESWDEIFFALEENKNNTKYLNELFKLIKNDNIIDLAKNQGLPLLVSFTQIFTDFIIKNSFDFDYCDILADKLITIFTYSKGLHDISLQAYVLLALLILGVDHNRWYVERKFASLATVSVDERIIDRLIFEANDKDIILKQKIDHLLWSISLDLNSLHPKFSKL